MIVCERTNNKAPCKAVEALQGVFLCPLILPLYITALVRPCVAYYKGFYFVCACVVCKLQRISIKIFLDFEIEMDLTGA